MSYWRRASVPIAAALALPACGSSGHSATSSGSAGAAASSTTTVSSSSTTPTLTIPPGAVAIAAGQPITKATFTHWLYVDAKSANEQDPGTPLIVPTDPPRFAGCIAQTRRVLPKMRRSSTAILRTDCRILFESLDSQTLDFLIRSDWYQALGARLQLTPSPADVTRELDADRRRQSLTKAGYRVFLRRSGETDSDLRERMLVDEIVTRLEARAHGTATQRDASVSRQLARMYRPTTRCAPIYRISSDCG